MHQTAKDDIVLRFTDGPDEYTIRVASRHGDITMPVMVRRLKTLLRDNVGLTAYIETSRFATVTITAKTGD